MITIQVVAAAGGAMRAEATQAAMLDRLYRRCITLRSVAVLASVLMTPAGYAPASEAADIRAILWKDRDYYAWIVFLSEGPVTWRTTPPNTPVADRTSVGHAYRVVHLVSEIYDTVLIEEITLGREGCCKKVRNVRKIDLDMFAQTFGFVGEVSGFQFLNWGFHDSFRFRFQGREFEAAGLGKSRLTISELSGR